MLAAILSGLFVVAGFVFGLLYGGYLGESWEHRVDSVWLPVIALSIFTVAVLGFLQMTGVPFRALRDIDAERRMAPEGPCAAEKLRPELKFLAVSSATLLAASAGQYVRVWRGQDTETASMLAAAAVGFTLAAAFCWYRLKVGGLRA
jgi:hypothetical protein